MLYKLMVAFGILLFSGAARSACPDLNGVYRTTSGSLIEIEQVNCKNIKVTSAFPSQTQRLEQFYEHRVETQNDKNIFCTVDMSDQLAIYFACRYISGEEKSYSLHKWALTSEKDHLVTSDYFGIPKEDFDNFRTARSPAWERINCRE